MKFKIQRTVLLNNLNKVSRAVSNKSPLPILSGIKFEVLDQGLVLTGSDSDITIQTFIEAKEGVLDIIKTGSVVLSNRYISEIVRKIDSNEVTFEILDGQLTRISGSGSEFNLNGTKSIDYPRIDLSKTGEHFDMNSLIFKKVIEQTTFATSDKETRPALTGVNFKTDGDVIECIATDSYRLSKKIIPGPEGILFNITIPGKSLTEVARIIENDCLIDFYITDRKVLFCFDNVTIQTRLIDGTFPNTSRLIPSEFNYTLNIDSREFLGAIDRASLFAEEETNHVVKLSLSKDNCILSSFSQEVGSVEENLSSALFDGNDLVISFSAKYLIEAIRAISSEKITIRFTQEMAPFVVTNKNDNSIIELLLPVRTYN